MSSVPSDWHPQQDKCIQHSGSARDLPEKMEGPVRHLLSNHLHQNSYCGRKWQGDNCNNPCCHAQLITSQLLRGSIGAYLDYDTKDDQTTVLHHSRGRNQTSLAGKNQDTADTRKEQSIEDIYSKNMVRQPSKSEN
ncbi:hypothetical protein CHS0354_011323 [Potamilus streckersoni]|uniref:Uncharacterized protein n=1 Tax=Potamilus streckersoni TaxID=2493646 RepID=A0AAE0WBD8_9BIVA|nr:hypothetical protein CHS0354_011323 [Potamilus streckersoni]